MLTVLSEFDVSGTFLIKLYKSSSAPPTENASDGDNADDDHAHDDHAHNNPMEEISGIYLVEPMRLTTTVVKFSGTLSLTTCNDLRSLTVTVFAHYVAQETACHYIFTDIQGVSAPFGHIQRLKRRSPIAGSNNASTNGKLLLTLFDPMTHTVEG